MCIHNHPVRNCCIPTKRYHQVLRKTSPSYETGFITSMKADFNTVLERHAVDVRKALAEFREASARRHDTSAQEYHFDNNVPNRSSVQRRLSIYNWNPGPRRGREGAGEKQIAGKWHTITMQEAIEHVDRELLANRFHVTLHRGGVQFCSTRTSSSLMSRSNPSTFTISGAYCQIRWLKETQAGFYKACCDVSLFVGNLPAAQNIKKLILTIREVMLDEQVDFGGL